MFSIKTVTSLRQPSTATLQTTTVEANKTPTAVSPPPSSMFVFGEMTFAKAKTDFTGAFVKKDQEKDNIQDTKPIAELVEKGVFGDKPNALDQKATRYTTAQLRSTIEAKKDAQSPTTFLDAPQQEVEKQEDPLIAALRCTDEDIFGDEEYDLPVRAPTSMEKKKDLSEDDQRVLKSCEKISGRLNTILAQPISIYHQNDFEGRDGTWPYKDVYDVVSLLQYRFSAFQTSASPVAKILQSNFGVLTDSSQMLLKKYNDLYRGFLEIHSDLTKTTNDAVTFLQTPDELKSQKDLDALSLHLEKIESNTEMGHLKLTKDEAEDDLAIIEHKMLDEKDTLYKLLIKGKPQNDLTIIEKKILEEKDALYKLRRIRHAEYEGDIQITNFLTGSKVTVTSDELAIALQFYEDYLLLLHNHKYFFSKLITACYVLQELCNESSSQLKLVLDSYEEKVNSPTEVHPSKRQKTE